MRGPILVTGGSGQVGGAVARLARARGIEVEAPPRAQLDLTKPGELEAAVAARRWAAVLNCAAYTAVDRAESEPKLARAVNAEAPAVLASAAVRARVPLIHVSTDYVFDGRKPAPYLEDDPTGPLQVYGATKLAGEQAVRAVHPNHAIVRSAWIVSAGPANFVDTMLRLAAERDSVRVVADQHGCPTAADDLAAALLAIAARLGARAGTWHFASAGATTWHGLAAHVFAGLGRRGLPAPKLAAIATADYPTAARRPANSRLACGRIAADFALAPRPWQEAVDAILAERLGDA